MASGTKINPQVALRSLAADKGYDDMSFHEELRAENIHPLIKHRVFAPYNHAHDARIGDDLSNQRLICEIVNLVINCSYSLVITQLLNEYINVIFDLRVYETQLISRLREDLIEEGAVFGRVFR